MVHSQWLSWFSLLMILSKTAKKKKKKIHRKLQFLISLAFFLQQRPMGAWKGWRTGREACAAHAQ